MRYRIPTLSLAGLLAVALAAVTVQAGESGCGLGGELFKQNDKGHQILAATTNGSFGTQTFGISSETSGCNPDNKWWSMRVIEQERFVRANIRDLSKEMAAGGGEYVTSLSTLMGCSSAAELGSFAQERYEAIFPSAGTDAGSMLNNLRQELRLDAGKSVSCSVI